jgi:hypothetical protein
MIERHVTFDLLPGKEKEFEALYKESAVRVYEVIPKNKEGGKKRKWRG